MNYSEYVFGKSLCDIDPEVGRIIGHEEARQKEKIILIPSESICPAPVLEALGSALNNIYAEGYPSSMMVGEEEPLITDFDFQLTRYRRYSDRRFYKGCEYANFLETLVGRRAADLFCTAKNPPEQIHVNVQPLSGSVANIAIYDAFLASGDVLMGMSLMHGGHLSHGSEFNRSGKMYRIVSYEVNPGTEKLDYDQIADLAKQWHPKMIVAGYTSYPWAPDWSKFREIADSVGALLLADISHPAGLIIAGVYPNPIDYADVTMCTTHKTLFGPRGAIIMTTNSELAEKIDQAIFPGEQGGPHVNKFAAMAVAFKIAKSEEFKEVQRNIVKNAVYLSRVLKKRGLKLAYGGTDTHIVLIDLNSIETNSGFPLKGEIAVRILDLTGIVANKNTIPGDTITAEASGVRLGTPWITQRGITEEGIKELGDIIAHVLKHIDPFFYEGLDGTLPRGKIELRILEEAKSRVSSLVQSLKSETVSISLESNGAQKVRGPYSDSYGALIISGRRARLFLEGISTCKVSTLNTKDAVTTFLLDSHGKLLAPVKIAKITTANTDRRRGDQYLLMVSEGLKAKVKTWFAGLSDGYAAFDSRDIFRKIDGPVVIQDTEDLPEKQKNSISDLLERSLKTSDIPRITSHNDAETLYRNFPHCFDLSKPYFIGQKAIERMPLNGSKVAFTYKEEEHEPKSSCLFNEHLRLGAHMVNFAGWKMPVRYESTIEEHRTVREKAGLFDISHMGVLEVSGKYATQFLDTLCTNYVPWIDEGESQYSFLLDPEGNVIDDIMIYKLEEEKYILVVNAANTDKDLAWMLAVNSRSIIIDPENPHKETIAEAIIRDLKNTSESGSDSLVNLTLQGPESLDILKEITDSERVRNRLSRLEKTKFMHTTLGGMDMIVSRTGYTGEKVGYELLVHPEKAAQLWNLLLESGENYGLKPIGLGARDSLRIEAGLSLHGNELAGIWGISPIEAGFGYYVKFHKAFFIGRDSLLKGMGSLKRSVVRFRMSAKGVRIAKPGDLMVSSRTQQIIGFVTSCAVDAEGVQVGMGYVDNRFTREGIKVGIVPSPAGTVATHKSLSELDIGDRFPLPVEALILSRFPEEE